ncbi:DeoR/GlpR family DNA-binding transcription regulator [Saccharopolyspora sp. TS4A08]|uniref:Lactose phosphotransferase system repressor n=1 Tax=Saccharopolyspora ipomoeae TaxID=3042027 RepID=A0ABT6PNY4_9PSEU|nr:DeoR/GlpR family DNA-binding transcription regulator [Saccharopolyspora sp. TS4A08]MDI2029550.1 DeoR/GlpR family DNA-binding transcription regulator [Saccharopolyspora sp. TS4A08]
MNSLAMEERIEWLRAELRSTGSVSLGDAAEALGVSEMTVRRDLRQLENEGVARRVRGGARHSEPASFQRRDSSRAAEKRLIAEKLLPLVPAQGLIVLDSSTTMYRLAALIPSAEALTVLTNSIQTFQVLQGRPGVTAELTGGRFDERSDSLIGPLAAATVERLTPDVFFASTGGIDGDSCFESTVEEAALKKACARVSHRTVIGADTAKLDARDRAASVELETVAALCTEVEPDDPQLAEYRKRVRQLL